MSEDYTSIASATPRKGRYANDVQVGYNAFEFVLDFGQCYPEEAEARYHSRIVTVPAYAKVLAETLRECLEQYEQRFGTLPQYDTASEPHR